MSGKFSGKEEGSAIIIAVLVMALLMGFASFAITRTNNETLAVGNDAAETRAFEAAQASLENMTTEFDLIFAKKVSASPGDIHRVETLLPTTFTANYDFTQSVGRIRSGEIVNASGDLQGLKALREEWQLDTVARDRSTGVEVALRRRFFNDRVPIFQFGIFYDDDLEFHPGPRFDFGGRVHSNGNLFLMAGTGLYFNSKVSAVKNVISEVARNGSPASNWGANVFIKNANGTYVQLTPSRGSVRSSVVNGANLYAGNPDMPALYRSTGWTASEGLFQGNLAADQKRLDLPLKIASQEGNSLLDYIELVKRGKFVGDKWNDGSGTVSSPSVVPVTAATTDSAITAEERYANKTGIRVSLADSRDRLPGCASAVSSCGIRLDGERDGDGDEPGLGQARGYQPLQMANGERATPLNGERIRFGGKQNWIKIELVSTDDATGNIIAREVTEDILSLGLTEQAPLLVENLGGGNTYTHFRLLDNRNDSRAIFKMQRYTMPGVSVRNVADTNFVTFKSIWGTVNNMVISDDANGVTADDVNPLTNLPDHNDNQANVRVENTKNIKIAPYPIMMFDTREGLFNDSINPNSAPYYVNAQVPLNGVMSMLDIDVANLRSFLKGDYNGLLPSNTPFAISKGGVSLRSTDVPNNKGWVLYISDRRGDFDFDGEYDMEDIYGYNDGLLQMGEDVNRNGSLQAEYTNEAPRYSQMSAPERAFVIGTPYYRRGVRLINGTTLPGIYDAAVPANTLGFTVASENAVYVKGNYNATGISSVGSPTPATGFLPQNTSAHIPASIVADAVMILSNAWNDSRSFRYPFDLANRPADETTVRFAMLGGDAMSSLNATPNQGGGDPRLGGGVHNFKRFLENWGGDRLNYSGSLINLFNARNNNGAFKCCSRVYSPPNRNWVYDISFLDPNRLPPGTPYFQYISLTGFRRTNQ